MDQPAETPADTSADKYAQFTGTRPVAPQHAFDEAKLADYLHAHMPALAAGAIQVAQFKGGQSNPTFMITAADGQRYVMRRKPPGVLLQSAHAVDREFRVISALHGTASMICSPAAASGPVRPPT